MDERIRHLEAQLELARLEIVGLRHISGAGRGWSAAECEAAGLDFAKLGLLLISADESPSPSIDEGWRRDREAIAHLNKLRAA